jgi:uncharacterized protein VirK/YbjX
MHIKVDVDITPEEVRRLMGLPDVQAFQQELMDRIKAQMLAGAEGYDPLTLFRPFLEQTASSMESFQKLFGGLMAAGASAGTKNKRGES